VKPDGGKFHENLSKKMQFGLKSYENINIKMLECVIVSCDIVVQQSVTYVVECEVWHSDVVLNRLHNNNNNNNNNNISIRLEIYLS
jgi:hypothetical protein